MIAFCVSILAFVWRTGSSTDNPQPLTPVKEIGPRVAVTFLFVLGLVNFLLVVRTFKSYGGGRPRGPYAAINLNMRNVLDAALGANSSVGGAVGGLNQRLSENTTVSNTDLEKGRVLSPQERGRRVSPRL